MVGIITKVANYYKMKILAANCLKLIDVAFWLRLLRFAQFSLIILIFRDVIYFFKLFQLYPVDFGKDSVY